VPKTASFGGLILVRIQLLCKTFSIVLKMKYFGETFRKEDCNRTCDNCSQALSYTLRDIAEDARNIAALCKIRHVISFLIQCI
jgi:hypothetical protein